MVNPKEMLDKFEGGEEVAEEGREYFDVGTGVAPASIKGIAQKKATGYPTPLGRYRLYVEGYNISIEEPYYWILHYLREMFGFVDIYKITDVFAAAENSAFFGVSQQRIGLQQDKVSQFLATVGKMVKELFQLVRELRVLDERLAYYVDSYSDSRSRESAEITLKGIWVDMVEQGAKNPASVYGMSREVQFTTLPDLFFSTHPKKQEDVDEVVERDRAQFNRKVREVLMRKLRTFLTWKEHTFEEIKTRRVFTLKYLRQHYEIIKMYMAWVKPYLRNVQRLHMDQSKMETPDLLVAFETSMIEVEIMAVKNHKEVKISKSQNVNVNQVIISHFWFRTRPEMQYQQEGYQRGPIHVGRVQMNFRCYMWTDREVESYKSYRKQEDFKLLELIDLSVKAAMDALGDELMKYLAEAGEDIGPMPDKIQQPTIRQRGLYKTFSQGLHDLFSSKKSSPATEKRHFQVELAKYRGGADVRFAMYKLYEHFKKRHNMLTWW